MQSMTPDGAKEAGMKRLVTVLVLGGVLAWGMVPASAAVRRGESAAVPVRAPEAVRGDAAHELLERSGLRLQLESLVARIESEFRVTSAHFEPGALYGRVREAFAGRAEPVQLERALAWFRSPLGQRVVALEVTAAMPGRDEELRAFLGRLEAERPSPERLALLHRLDAAGLATETSLDITLAILRSLVDGRELMAPAEVENRLTDIRARARDRMRQASLFGMLFAYQGLTDGELAELTLFVESDAGQWFVNAVSDLVVRAVGRAAEQAAPELVRSTRWERRLPLPRDSRLAE
jgi:hypothetical protein